jgi:ATP-dependent protease HslVU (ClpYQ) ATPase subunit
MWRIKNLTPTNPLDTKDSEEKMENKFAGALSIVQAMHYLGNYEKTKLYDLIKRGEICVTRIDTIPVIFIEELDEFLARESRKNDGR